MNIDRSIDDVFVALKVIASIQPMQRLCTQQYPPSTDKAWPFQGIYRWFFRDSRATMITVIDTTLKKALTIATNALQENKIIQSQNKSDSGHAERTMLMFIRGLESDQVLTRLVDAMQQSLSGIKNMKETYANDSVTVAKLDLIIDNTVSALERIESSKSS